MNKVLKIIFIASLGLFAILSKAELRDPTRPADFSFTPSQRGALKVSSIIIAPDRQIAVINDVIVNVGDEILGNKVVEINANTVQLDGGGGRITLFLLDTPLKQKVNNKLK